MCHEDEYEVSCLYVSRSMFDVRHSDIDRILYLSNLPRRLVISVCPQHPTLPQSLRPTEPPLSPFGLAPVH